MECICLFPINYWLSCAEHLAKFVSSNMRSTYLKQHQWFTYVFNLCCLEQKTSKTFGGITEPAVVVLVRAHSQGQLRILCQSHGIQSVLFVSSTVSGKVPQEVILIFSMKIFIGEWLHRLQSLKRVLKTLKCLIC